MAVDANARRETPEAASASADSLRADRLSVGYGGQALVEGISLALEPGTVLSLIGPNGAGKTTVLRTITKFLAAIAGTVSIDGRAITRINGHDLARQVAVVLTERLKTELMTCEDVVATGRYPHTGRFGVLGAADRRQVREAMELLHAWELRDRDFEQISDGQKQRILIARALCQDPRVIVLDEPTAYLDVRYKLELLTILRQLAKDRGITVVMSLHELDMAQKVSDLILCVDGSTVSRLGTPAEIFVGDRINQLFHLDHGGYDPLFGSLEFAAPTGEPDVFVIAGGDVGVPAYRALQRRGVPFATGVLHHGDVDYHVARSLASDVVVETAFEPISEPVLRRALDRLRGCRAVVNCLASYGTLNAKNRLLAEEARQRRIPLVTDVADLRL